jgi:hypothetical protein
MELFKKVYLNLFKIVLAISIAILSRIVDLLFCLEDILKKLHANPFLTREEYLQQLREEYMKENIEEEDIDYTMTKG